MNRILSDLRYAMRRLLQRPAFALSVVMTLALGLGAACLYGDVVDAVLLRPVPYADAQRLVYVWETDAHNASSREGVSWPDLRDWRAAVQSFDALGAYMRQSLTIAESEGEPERVVVFAATADLLPMLGVRAEIGRVFQPGDDLAQAAPVVVLSHALWRGRYGADPRILGKTVQLDGVPHEVIGVLPEQPGAPLAPQAWTPVQRALDHFVEERGVHTLTVIAHLRDGVSVAHAQQEMDALSARLEARYPQENTGRGARVEDMHAYAVRDVRRPLELLGGVFALLLLIAAVNVASLLLAQGGARHRELAVRSAIGAPRARIARQLATEGMLLGLFGGVAGIALVPLALAAFRAWGPADLLDISLMRPDAVLGWTGVAVAVLFGALAASVPLLPLLRASLPESLRGTGLQHLAYGSSGRRALVAVQVALAMALALCSGLLLRGFWEMTQLRTGLVSERAIALSFSLPRAQFPMPPLSEYPHWPAVTQAFDRMLEQVRGVEGVRAAALGHAAPLHTSWTTHVRRADAVDPDALRDEWEMRPVSPGYFSTLGIPLLRGRDLQAADREGAALVVLINEAAARRYFPGEDPLGKHLVLWDKEREVIGVTGDVRSIAPSAAAAPAVFPPLAQTPFTGVTLVVRSSGEPLTLLPALREAIHRAQPDLALFNVATLDQQVQNAFGGMRFGTGVVTAFALVALALAAVGVFGIVALEVAQRAAEIGLRVALGARRRDVLRLALGRTFATVTLGALAGGVLTLFAGHVLQSVLFGVSAHDPLALAGSLAALFAIALFASVLPVRRALRIEPIEALRHE
jgi:putative ABC transport system permease protein